MLSGKTVLIGITGGIAAYKICELIRMYKRANAEVLVVCTQNALNFVTKLTLENLSKNPVAVEEFNVEKLESINFIDVNFAALVKREVEEESICSTTRCWQERTGVQPKLLMQYL